MHIAFRWAEWRNDRLPALAADLVASRVSVIAATGGGPSIMAAQAATTTIPIVFTFAGDPVKAGIVGSFNEPSGNITGISWFGTALGAKRLELLLQLVPDAAVVALLLNPNNPEAAPQPLDFEQAARRLGREFRIVNAGSDTEIDAAFAALVEQRVRALVVGSDPLLFSRRGQVIALAAFRSFHLLLSLTNLAIVLTKLISKQAPTLGREGTGLMWGTTNQALAEQPWH